MCLADAGLFGVLAVFPDVSCLRVLSLMQEPLHQVSCNNYQSGKRGGFGQQRAFSILLLVGGTARDVGSSGFQPR